MMPVETKPGITPSLQERRKILFFGLSTNMSTILGTWLMVYSLSNLKLIPLLIGVVCFIAALYFTATLHHHGHKTEMKRTAIFSILSMGIVFFLLSAAYLFDNLNYPDEIVNNPIALLSITMTIFILPTSLYTMYKSNKNLRSLLDNVTCSGVLVLGVAGVVLSPYPIILRMQDSNYDPSGFGICFSLAMLSFLLIPLGVFWRWRIMKRVNTA